MMDTSEAMDIEEEEEERTRVFPRELPLQFSYARPRYYVRRCYSEYYSLILEMLETYDIVTVTGTPGIGKSIFYAYFYQRYKEDEEDEENKENRRKTTIIAASFTKASGMGEVVAFQDGKQTEPSDDEEASSFIKKTYKAAWKDGNPLLYLYDRPPQRAPKRPSKMVCFTSPNERWLEEVRKEEQARKLYMPLWTLEELMDAANHLGLGADVTQKIEERFAIFGGVARGCLSAREKFVAEMTEDLTKAIAGMDSFSELKRLVNNVEGGATRCRMCHYQPMADNRGSYDVQIASTFVSRLVLENVTARDFEKRDSLIRWLKGIPKAAAFRGHLSEMKAHERLVRGGTIETQCISKPDMPMKRFTLDQSEEFCFFDLKDLSSTMLQNTENPYHIPRAANFESVDSFYLPPPTRSSLPLKLHVATQTTATVSDDRVIVTSSEGEGNNGFAESNQGVKQSAERFNDPSGVDFRMP
ncbi:hypothetical protein V7S43_005548 [Phytophthora oleae]|uniref:Uncharacterized protein n=1 Tax=Phytophthora oleae TaxID=2107226 RepID=A0ABD3FS90_9STRA